MYRMRMTSAMLAGVLCTFSVTAAADDGGRDRDRYMQLDLQQARSLSAIAWPRGHATRWAASAAAGARTRAAAGAASPHTKSPAGPSSCEPPVTRTQFRLICSIRRPPPTGKLRPARRGNRPETPDAERPPESGSRSSYSCGFCSYADD